MNNRSRAANIFCHIDQTHDEGGWEPSQPASRSARIPKSDAMPGTSERVRAYQARILAGQPMWNNDDRSDAEENR